MTDEFLPSPEQLQVLMESAFTISQALMVASLKSEVAAENSAERAAATADVMRLAGELLAVPHITPQLALLTVARTGATSTVALSKHLNLDPVELAENGEHILLNLLNGGTA